MKKIGALLLVISALAFGVLMQERAKASDEETQLIQLERAWSQAETGVDPSAIARLFEETLVYVDYDGSLMNKAEYLRSVANPVSHGPEVFRLVHERAIIVHINERLLKQASDG